jgi:hypothetical protein
VVDPAKVGGLALSSPADSGRMVVVVDASPAGTVTVTTAVVLTPGMLTVDVAVTGGGPAAAVVVVVVDSGPSTIVRGGLDDEVVVAGGADTTTEPDDDASDGATPSASWVLTATTS